MKLQVVDYFFGVQGIFLVANGLFFLLAPQQAAAVPMLKGTPRNVLLSSSLMSMSLGACYLQAAYAQNRTLMKMGVVGRSLAFGIFGWMGDGMMGVAYFEALMAASTAFLLKAATPLQ